MPNLGIEHSPLIIHSITVEIHFFLSISADNHINSLLIILKSNLSLGKDFFTVAQGNKKHTGTLYLADFKH